MRHRKRWTNCLQIEQNITYLHYVQGLFDKYHYEGTWKEPPTVDAGVAAFTLLTAVMVVALTKGPLAGTIISCVTEIGRQGRGTRGLRRAILGGAWLKWLTASKKIAKIQIHAGPVCQTRCCCILMKGNVIVEPRFPRELAGSLDNQQLALSEIVPPGRVCTAEDPREWWWK